MSDPIPNDIASQEVAIVARLQSKIGAQVKVEAFPDNPKNYRMLHPVGAVLVAYHGSSYSKPQAVDVVVQDRTPEWDVVLEFRNLRAHGGAYAFLDAVRLALTGFELPGCTKLYPVREKFLDQDDGIWKYAMTFANETLAVEADSTDDAILPLLKRVTIDDPAHGDLEVQSND